MDEPGWIHLLEITLPIGYLESPPSISADIPYLLKNTVVKNLKNELLRQWDQGRGQSTSIVAGLGPHPDWSIGVDEVFCIKPSSFY
ncbi:hypothetical protein SORBI_3003G162666 [Sorghum bicolor]|uniref:Uncharacterized protein n=1 Tax=Sorghum bicolor TaxID=4558 RepID=A0A1W0VXL8_SORBI|nr:hypothetical protein SORBI_3003G162666 [Sorghum bicolor]